VREKSSLDWKGLAIGLCLVIMFTIPLLEFVGRYLGHSWLYEKTAWASERTAVPHVAHADAGAQTTNSNNDNSSTNTNSDPKFPNAATQSPSVGSSTAGNRHRNAGNRTAEHPDAQIMQSRVATTSAMCDSEQRKLIKDDADSRYSRACTSRRWCQFLSTIRGVLHMVTATIVIPESYLLMADLGQVWTCCV
jgi:hypothetical protein